MRAALLVLCVFPLACGDASPASDAAQGVDGSPGVDNSPGVDGSPGVVGAAGPDGSPGGSGAAGVEDAPFTPFRFGAAAMDFGKAIGVDPNDGAVWVTGYTSAAVDFDPGTSVMERTAASPTIFLAKYDRTGRFLRVLTFGGAGPNMPHSVRVGADGAVTVAGFFSGTADFDPGPAEVTRASAGGRDAFVAQWSGEGALRWAVTFGAAGDDEIADLALDAQGRVHVTGTVGGAVDLDPGPGAAPLAPDGGDAFVATYAAGGSFVRSTQIGGPGAQAGYAIASEPSGAVVVSGTFAGPFVCGGERVSAGPVDVFVARFDAAGAQSMCFTVGGPGFDLVPPGGIDVDTAGNIALGGRLQGAADLDPSPAVRTVTSLGADDLFLAKYTREGAHAWSFAAGGPLNDSLHRVRFLADGSLIAGGWFRSTIDVDPSERVDTRAGHGGATSASDVLVARYTAAGALMWAESFGGDASEEDTRVASNTLLAGLTVDASGASYVTGRFFGTSRRADAPLWTSAGSGDAFVLKLGASGELSR